MSRQVDQREMMKSTMIYARVSSDRQEHEGTIQSQLEELRWRVKEDGIVACQEFIDEGHSRNTPDATSA